MIARSDSPAAALLDTTHLRTFPTVAQTLSFTAAAQRLCASQSTVSKHVRKLEEAVGRALLERDTHSVTLTADGGAMVGFAREILDSNERAVDYFAGLVELPADSGLPRLGEIEFVLTARGRGESGPGAELANAILAAEAGPRARSSDAPGHPLVPLGM